jgi:hypothetical protein
MGPIHAEKDPEAALDTGHQSKILAIRMYEVPYWGEPSGWTGHCTS